MAMTVHLDVVSAEEKIFSGEADHVVLPGESGELGIWPRHTPLLTRIRPGAVRIKLPEGGEEFVYVSGGMLEVHGAHAALRTRFATEPEFREGQLLVPAAPGLGFSLHD